MPIHRVQALKVTTGILRRRFGWHGLERGQPGAGRQGRKPVIVPFAQMAEIVPVVATTGFALPGAADEWHHASREAADRQRRC